MKEKFYRPKPIFLLLLTLTLFSGCVYFKAITSRGPGIGDMNRYPLCTLSPALKFDQTQIAERLDTTTYSFLTNDFFDKTKTRAFLILKEDTIRFSYFEKGVDQNEQTDLFSITKSVLSALVGIAVEENLIHSIEDSVGRYLGNRYPLFSNTRIIDLMDMRAGIDEKFILLVRLYYGRNLPALLGHIEKDPLRVGTYTYSNASAQLLSEVLEGATGISVITYFKEKLWNNLGMQHKGSWSYDSSRSLTARGFCGLNMSAFDLLKFGCLYLHNGTYNGRKLISPEWILFTRTIRNKNTSLQDGWDYNLFWRNVSNHEIFAKGLLGQFLYVNWDKNTVIIRLGYKEGKTDWVRIFQEVSNK
ncbi:MAG: serine hydrolase [Bacteroidales bacterium]